MASCLPTPGCGRTSDAAQDSDAAQGWFRRRCAELYQGEVHEITTRLDTAGLSDHAFYFQAHQRRMQYQTHVEEGYPIGSGTVEGGIKQLKGRLTGPGMRWSRPAAQTLLVIRGAGMAQDFDTLWDAA